MMVERKLYKTRLCVLYKRGNCPRETCSFAHGSAELRRFSAELRGRQDNRVGDLRDRLGRRHYSPRRHSPERDRRDRHINRGYSPSRSLHKRSGDRENRKKQQANDESDFSGSLNSLDELEGRVKLRNPTSSDSRDVLYEQLRQVHSDIDLLEEDKHQLEIFLEKKDIEAEGLTSKIEELKMQLRNEKEECERVFSKIRKFIKAHNRHSRIQDELKRSQARLQKLGNQLGSDSTRLGADEEDTSVNILTDEENIGNYTNSPQNVPQKNAPFSKKRPPVQIVEAGEPKKASLVKAEIVASTVRQEKLSRWNPQLSKVNQSRYVERDDDGRTDFRTSADEPRRGRNILSNISSADKSKDSETSLVIPSTGMAAHAVDEVVEVVDVDEKLEVEENQSAKGEVEDGHETKDLPLPLPPPPPILPNAYQQYQGIDEKVDVDGPDDEMVDVDIV